MTHIDLFTGLLNDNIGDLRSWAMVKGKFIGKYIASLKTLNLDSKGVIDAKELLVVNSFGGITWLDYILGLSDDELKWFIFSINEK